MSLILEALKKSEQQRRLGEAPTLGSPMLVARKRRNLLPFLVLLIALAAGAGWWFSREPAGSAPQVAADATAPAAAPATASPQATPVAADARPAPSTVAATPPARPARAAPPSAAPPADAKPSPKANPMSQLPPAARPDTPVAPAVANVATRPAPAQAPAPAPSAGTSPPPRRMTPPAAPATPAVTSAPAAPAPAPRLPALQSVWDLPFATRKDLPEIQLTMHLYSPDPRERFVVVEGERHMEGDDLGDGLVLKEIRPDGMALEFKGQKFLYPRDGR